MTSEPLWPHVKWALEINFSPLVLKWGRRSGKTTFLVEKARRLLRKGEKVLIVTPHLAGAECIRERVKLPKGSLCTSNPDEARGQSPHALLIDEYEYFGDRWAGVLYPFLETKGIEIFAVGTPSEQKTDFARTLEESGILIRVPSSVRPDFSLNEVILRQEYTPEAWRREVLALS